MGVVVVVVCVTAERPGPGDQDPSVGSEGRLRSCSTLPLPFSIPYSPVALPIEEGRQQFRIRPHALVLMSDLSFLLQGDSGPYARAFGSVNYLTLQTKGARFLYLFICLFILIPFAPPTNHEYHFYMESEGRVGSLKRA